VPSTDRFDTPHGAAVIVELDDVELAAVAAALPAGEQAVIAALGAVRRRDFIAGRTALRALVPTDAAIVADDRGAPVMPAGWVGSISHKGARAAAIVAAAGEAHLGIDLERAVAPKLDIARRILTVRERAAVRDDREVTLRFAIKEAIYKAIDPIVRRYVGFTEVELELELDGARGGVCGVTVLDRGRLPVVIDAWWTERDGHWVATARATRG
jgi:4'-phosphopantetheinyl transferase EntD